MTESDYVELGRRLGAAMQARIEPLMASIKAFETRVAAIKDGAPGPQGEPGKDVPPELVDELRAEIAEIKSSLDRLRSEWPDIDWVTDLVAAKVAEAVAALPKPKDGSHGERGPVGEPGKDGAPGPAGPQGAKGDTGDAGPQGPAGAQGPLGPAGAVGEPGQQGDVGLQGAKGDQGDRGPAGVDGAPGRDGRDGLPGVQGEKGLDGKDGRDGADGKDGLGFDDIQVEHDGERSFTFRFVRGDQVKTFGAFRVPVQIYRGVFEEGRPYELGDTVTWGGSMWHARQETKAKPGLASDESRAAWVMCVRKGSEGKTGPEGRPGKPGPMGPQGPTGRSFS